MSSTNRFDTLAVVSRRLVERVNRSRYLLLAADFLWGLNEVNWTLFVLVVYDTSVHESERSVSRNAL